MPLTMVNAGEKKKILRINGKDETRRFLNNLGLVEGCEVAVVSKISGDLIINIKDTKIAIDRTMANRIVV